MKPILFRLVKGEECYWMAILEKGPEFLEWLKGFFVELEILDDPTVTGVFENGYREVKRKAPEDVYERFLNVNEKAEMDVVYGKGKAFLFLNISPTLRKKAAAYLEKQTVWTEKKWKLPGSSNTDPQKQGRVQN